MIRRWCLLVLFYSTVTAVMVEPFINYRALDRASYAGDARLVIWTLAWDNHALLDRLPLFDSNIFYPATKTLAYNEHLFGLSLFTLPVYAATRNPVLAYNLVWLASFLLNALATHTLLRRYTGSHLSAIVGSVLFTFSFYKMLHGHGHLHLVWTWLLPLSILCLERWCDRPALIRGLLWGATIALQALTSWYLAVMVAVVQTIVALSLIPQMRERHRFEQAWQLVLVASAIAILMWPFARPYTTLSASPRSEVASYSADLAGYLIPPENTWSGQLWLAHVGRGPRWIWGEQTVFIGWTALALGGIGATRLLMLRRWRVFAVFSAFTVGGFLLSLGPSLSGGVESWSLFQALTSLPGLGAFRAPARFATLVLLGLSALCAFGADLVHRRIRLGRIILVLLLPVMLSEWYVVKFPGRKPEPFFVPEIYKVEILASAQALVSLPDYRDRPDWYVGADYLYFATAHWRPIVNGFGRTEPRDHARIISHMKAFPGPNNAKTMREIGVDYVVFHAARQPIGAAEIVREATDGGEYVLAAQIGSDYLFKVRPVPVPRQ